MNSCGFACDFVLSALRLSKYDTAKKLCEILLITDRNKFAFLYGIVNIALKNYHITRTVCSSNFFKVGLISALESENWDGLSLETLSSEEIIEKIQNEIQNESNLLLKIFSGKYFQIVELKFISFP